MRTAHIRKTLAEITKTAMQQMIQISSYYTKFIQILSLLVVLLNISGIILMKTVIPEEIALTYDLTLNYSLVFLFGLLLIISSFFFDVKYDKRNKEFKVKQIGRKTLLFKKNNIISIKYSYFSKCEIIFESKNSQKKINFIPSLLYFPPFSNKKKVLEEIINE